MFLDINNQQVEAEGMSASFSEVEPSSSQICMVQDYNATDKLQQVNCCTVFSFY